ncbi:MAG: DUF4093 domain-containing protein [Oscillospiraceae bacterium]|nr:DUF4093 domain-containing protein [Oscillospiraceae bacterium]
MIKIREAIVVEGRYDKNTLSQIVDAPIFQTNGFRIMKDKEQMTLLRCVAQKRGLIILTDSDGAGFVIRNHIKSGIPKEFLKHAYIPEISGKERRKATAGKEGILGVEGMTPQVILDCLKRAGATLEGENTLSDRESITKFDLFCMGLSGGPDSKAKRLALLKKLELPQHMSSNAMLEALNLLYSKDELYRLLDTL